MLLGHRRAGGERSRWPERGRRFAEDLTAGDRVLVVDDVLATGGTAEASLELIRRAGADVAGLAVLMELGFLGGRARLERRSGRGAAEGAAHGLSRPGARGAPVAGPRRARRNPAPASGVAGVEGLHIGQKAILEGRIATMGYAEPDRGTRIAHEESSCQTRPSH
ncbi:Adenine phosphoribosyltransferase [Streptomyces violaceorubidus]